MPKRNHEEAHQNDLLPVTVISGFLGSGKTTLLKRILTNDQGLRIAMLVNDMSEINVDGDIVKELQKKEEEEKNNPLIMRGKETLVELTNGCICCTLREDLVVEVAKLAQQPNRPFDYLVIESTGVAEPLPVAEAFSIDFPGHESLRKFTRLDTLVTVVDACQFSHYLGSEETLEEYYKRDDLNEDDRVIPHLLLDQIEVANVILLNKNDLVSAAEGENLHKLLTRINPSATILKSTYSNIELDQILNTHSFAVEQVSSHKDWLAPLHIPETIEYGIGSFVYRRRVPFHPQRLDALVSSDFFKDHALIRSKGACWIASAPHVAFRWQHAGNVWDMTIAGPWSANIQGGDDDADAGEQEAAILAELQARKFEVPFPPRSQPRSRLAAKELQKLRLVDQRQEIVFIGTFGNEAAKTIAAVEGILDAALLTDKEWERGPSTWASWVNETVDELVMELAASLEDGHERTQSHSHSHHHPH